jgi:hypothetical protein
MLDKAAATYDTLSIADLRQALQDPVADIGRQLRGMVLENLSIDPSSRLSPWKNGNRWINVTDQSGNKAKVCIPPPAWTRALEKGYAITSDVAIDVALSSLNIDKWMQVEIEALAVRVSGQSKLEALREKIIAYCEQRNYFKRPKKPLPVIIRKVAIVTTANSTIESDIINQIGIRKELITSHRFDGTAPVLRDLINGISRRREHDIIVLYRGGREDEFMFVFSDPMILDAVVQSHIPVAAAIGHERDKPPVEMVADMGFASPSKFAEFVRRRNEEALKQAGLCLQNIEHRFRQYILAVENDAFQLIGTINAIASDLVRKNENKEHRRSMILTIVIAALLLSAVIAFFLLRA